jgi:arylsulfatase A
MRPPSLANGIWATIRSFCRCTHGFDEYLGLPYSNDMWPRHPQQKNFYPDLPLIEGDKVRQLDPDQSQLTTMYTERAVKFIEKSQDKPFFLYLAHSMPHVPLFVSDKFKGKTRQGLFGDVIEEVDWSAGQILDTLKRLKLENNTLVIFTSDNGPWLSYGNHAGSPGRSARAKALRLRAACASHSLRAGRAGFPKARVSKSPAMTIDLLPTLANLVKAPLPKHKLDGLDIWPLLTNRRGAQTPHEYFYFYYGKDLQAIRSGKWKLHLPHPYQSLEFAGNDGAPGKYVRKEIELSLFDLEKDAGETTNLAAQQPAVVQRMLQYAEQARADLGDALTKREGQGVRPAGQLAK